MAPGVPREAVEYMEKVFKKAWETEEFQGFMKKQGMTPMFMGSKEFGSYLNKSHLQYERTLKKLNLIKNK